MVANLNATKITSNIYLAKVRDIRKSYFTHRMSKAQDQEAELFCIVLTLFGIGHSDRPSSSISCDQFAAFFKQKVEAICWDLDISL